MFDHVTLDVASHSASRAFYERALAPLGWSVVAEWPGGCGLGTQRGGPTLWLRAEGRVSGPVHLAFRAASRQAVRDFHARALAAGGHDNGAPGLRDYHADYYGAFVLDPDGHNVEAVCHEPAETPEAGSDSSEDDDDLEPDDDDRD
jgi:catechol 2,3-dioxygenase-like lactoylglutathione lyase family enzyme